MSQPILRALISVSDKTGLIDFARALAQQGVELLSTGGTAKTLQAAGVPVIEVSAYTGFPEMMDGRVKTLQPKIHGGILALRDSVEHAQAMATYGIQPIDLVAVNLYPFEETVAKGAPFEDCIENIDIGGPALIRAAAKNHGFVTVVVDPADYAAIIAEMAAAGGTSMALRRRLAAKAYARTAAYDAAIADWFAGVEDMPFPERLTIAGSLKQMMRYGENPRQAAAFYVTAERRPGVASARQVQGKELSYNNLNDTDAAYELVAEFAAPAVAIIKHANPCGVAIGATLHDAYVKALACDPVSAFGGIVAVNRPLDAATAAEIAKIFVEVIIAPEVEAGAAEVLAAKKALRLLDAGGLPDPRAGSRTFKSLAGGFLVQGRDDCVLGDEQKVVTKRAPTNAEVRDLEFAMTVCKHVKSNAIVFARDGATVGIGAGQMSRVDSARIAVMKSEEARQAAGEEQPRTQGAVVASDAFFPFADGLIVCAEAGATAAIQPGGSVRDAEVIAVADERGLAMIFSGERHFRH
ncbi:MAG: bifunctional phosphoribosylaminoimidazolecarboxamide formyltransferase/IMP cyclohydrolase [Rhodospirillales bacterium]|nr:bifunctional phosphoribosylaminoimidazolecarboxamide formyltransferase/IMP cyclohydrolase [Rhodospirillales bacterium]